MALILRHSRSCSYTNEIFTPLCYNYQCLLLSPAGAAHPAICAGFNHLLPIFRCPLGHVHCPRSLQDSSREAVSRYCVSHSIVSHGQDKPGFAGAQLRSRKSWREAKGAPCHAEKTPPGKREVSSFPSVTAELGSCPETL